MDCQWIKIVTNLKHREYLSSVVSREPKMINSTHYRHTKYTVRILYFGSPMYTELDTEAMIRSNLLTNFSLSALFNNKISLNLKL